MVPAGGGRRSKIRPPRKFLVNSSSENSAVNTSGDPTIDFEKSWSILNNAIAQIQNKNVSNLSYEQLYRKAYILVIKKFGGKLYNNVAAIITQHLLIIRSNLVGLNCTNEEFLKRVIQEWDEHLQAMKFISDVLMYLNRVYVKEHKKLLVYDLGVQLFKDNIVKHNEDEVGNKIIQIVIDEITKSRNGVVITSNMYITKIINMLELLTEQGPGGENYYVNKFEPNFLRASEFFFDSLSGSFVKYQSGSRYLYESTQFIKDEESRIKFYLPLSTYPKLIELLNNIIIKDKIDQVITLPYEQQGLTYWLTPLIANITSEESEGDTYHYTDLSLLYNLIGRIDQEYQLLRLRLREGILLQGNSMPELVRNSIEASGTGDKKKLGSNSVLFASKWIETILKYRTQLHEVYRRSFDLNPSLEQTITMAMRDFINEKKRGVDSVNAPEMLSIYIDYFIKQLNKGSTTKDNSLKSGGDQIEEFITKSIQFLKFIKDKDAFEANYSNHFAKRFLNSKTSLTNLIKGVDIEELVLGKLCDELGTSSLNKIIRMNKDIKSSKDLTHEWKHHAHTTQLIDLDLKICNVTDWPKSMTKDYKWFSKQENELTPFKWPRQLRNTMREFEEYWTTNKNNNNKSLYWSPKFGSMDLRITYPSRMYEINMSTYAGIIMMLFAPQSNNADGSPVSAFDEHKQFTYDEILELTGIPELELKRHLQSIAVNPKSRLLIKVPMSKDVNNTDIFKLNEKFKSPSVKVKVLTVSSSSSTQTTKTPRTEQQEEIDEVQSNILEGRKLQVNAAIVRIMKSRQTMKHHNLIEELIKQLSSRFQPSMILVKQRIEDLIEREYLVRDELDRNIYHYVA
ncbi:Cullin-3-A [Spathaspora sp. JA1]|nr:Cullin-3-A [Spathaspora sp. JA1]